MSTRHHLAAVSPSVSRSLACLMVVGSWCFATDSKGRSAQKSVAPGGLAGASVPLGEVRCWPGAQWVVLKAEVGR